MAVKLKELSHDEYQELLDQEGDTVPLYVMCALHWKPPLPMPQEEILRRAEDEDEEMMIPYGMQDEYNYVFVVLLPVQEPCFYKSHDEMFINVLPSNTDLISYEMCNAIHPEHNAWAYRIQTKWWDAYNIHGDAPMDEAKWYFKPLPIKDYDAAEEATH